MPRICWLGLVLAFAENGVHTRPTPGLVPLCIAGGTGLAAANEVDERIATKLIPGTNVGGYESNTCWDLIANSVGYLLAGGLMAGGLIYFVRSKNSSQARYFQAQYLVLKLKQPSEADQVD